MCFTDNSKNFCSKCEVAIYCSKTCQVSNWKDHKKYCKKRSAINLSLGTRASNGEQKVLNSLTNNNKTDITEENHQQCNEKIQVIDDNDIVNLNNQNKSDSEIDPSMHAVSFKRMFELFSEFITETNDYQYQHHYQPSLHNHIQQPFIHYNDSHSNTISSVHNNTNSNNTANNNTNNKHNNNFDTSINELNSIKCDSYSLAHISNPHMIESPHSQSLYQQLLLFDNIEDSCQPDWGIFLNPITTDEQRSLLFKGYMLGSNNKANMKFSKDFYSIKSINDLLYLDLVEQFPNVNAIQIDENFYKSTSAIVTSKTEGDLLNNSIIDINPTTTSVMNNNNATTVINTTTIDTNMNSKNMTSTKPASKVLNPKIISSQLQPLQSHHQPIMEQIKKIRENESIYRCLGYEWIIMKLYQYRASMIKTKHMIALFHKQQLNNSNNMNVNNPDSNSNSNRNINSENNDTSSSNNIDSKSNNNNNDTNNSNDSNSNIDNNKILYLIDKDFTIKGCMYTLSNELLYIDTRLTLYEQRHLQPVSNTEILQWVDCLEQFYKKMCLRNEVSPVHKLYYQMSYYYASSASITDTVTI